MLGYTYIARLVLIHFADLNGTDLNCVQNVMTYTNLYTWWLINMVPIYSTCQWTAAGTFRYCGQAEMLKFWVILIRVFLQPVYIQTDRYLIKFIYVKGDTKERELLKNPTKIEEIKEKQFIDRNWTITTCLLRDSNPNYQCLKIKSRRWRHPPRMHSFTASTHFKSSRSFVSTCVCCMLCRMRQSRILQRMQHTQGDKKEREILKFVLAVKFCIHGGGRHLYDLIFKHW